MTANANPDVISLSGQDAAICRVPAELWCEIFLHASADGIIFDPCYYQHVQITPFILGAVCTPWRRIALSTAQLWSRLDIYLRRCDSMNKYPVSEIELCLERSKQMPLSIKLITSSQVHRDVMQSLVRNADRWQKLDFSIFSWSLFMHPKVTNTIAPIKDDLIQLLYAIPNLPALESFYYYCDGGDLCLPADLPMFHHAPKLRSLGIRSKFDIATGIPWSELTSFRSDLVFVAIVPMLQLCSGLRHLRLEASMSENNEDEDVDINFDKLVLPLDNLASLTVEVAEPYVSAIFFQKLRCMRLPALETLNLSCPSRCDWIEALRTVLACTGCGRSLTRLSITGSSRDGKLNQILSLLPNLKELRVNVKDWDSINGYGRGISFGPLVSQSLREISPPLVPHLVCLELAVVNGDKTFDCDEFVGMVASRWKPTEIGQMTSRGMACLELVKLSISSFFDKDTDAYRQLQTMKAEGLDLTIVEGFCLKPSNEDECGWGWESAPEEDEGENEDED